MIAQGSHASIAFLTRRIQQSEKYKLTNDDGDIWEFLGLTQEMREWINGRFTKVCVRVDSEDELLKIYKDAVEAGLEAHLITDSGQTEFGGQPTNTCLAIGPNQTDAIDRVTGHLRLL
jgi:PTH2 family peptidyl-tRNA hydrolase